MSLRNLAIEAYKNQTSIIEKNIILELELEGVFIFKSFHLTINLKKFLSTLKTLKQYIFALEI